MTTTNEIEFWIALDADGEFYIDTDAPEDAADNVGSVCRVFAFKMKLPMPKITEASVEVPDTDQPVTVTVA